MVTIYDWWTDIGFILIMKSEKAFGPMIFSISMMSIYALLSAIYVWFDSKESRNGILQFFNTLIFLEVYNSLYEGHAMQELQDIRLLETIFESAPQALLQIYFVMEYVSSSWTSDPTL